MAKDPAFLFYPGDFNTGTQFFSDDQVGKYMRLLMAQHQHGHLREDQVLFICKTYDKDVMSKFTKDKDGLWYNERLEIEVEKRKNYTASRKNNREGKTKEKNISDSYDPHMENRNENRNIDGINNKKGDVELFGDKSTLFVTVKAVYVNQKPKRIYSLQVYFESTDQLLGIVEAGWTDFDGFMRANPSAVFEDDKHLYSSFRKFCVTNKKSTASKIMTFEDL
jgi:uncharacterized protein YdaU (DUF1376 family)